LEQSIPKTKHLKRNVSPKKESSVALNTEQDDDCMILNCYKIQKLNKDEIMKRKKVLDDTIVSRLAIEKNVLPNNSQLSDETLDQFLRIVRETSCFETQSIQYLQHPQLITASNSDKSLQIIGGNCTNHWRCIYYDGSKLHVYDSIPGCTYKTLVKEEKNYIHKRFPQLNVSDIIFEKVYRQQDSTSCGIYAIAFATTIALGENPCDEKYSNDVQRMRNHLMSIINRKELLELFSKAISIFIMLLKNKIIILISNTNSIYMV